MAKVEMKLFLHDISTGTEFINYGITGKIS